MPDEERPDPFGTGAPSATVKVGAWKQQKPVPAIHFTVNNAGADQTYDGNCHLSLEVSPTKNFHVWPMGSGASPGRTAPT